MSNVKILYCPNEEPTVLPLIRKSVNEINAQSDVTVELTYVHSYQDLVERLSKNGRYDFAVLRLPLYAKGNYDPRQGLKSRFNGVLVAESTRCPHGKKDVLEHFDAYIGLIAHSQNLVNLLKQYKVLPQDFEL